MLFVEDGKEVERCTAMLCEWLHEVGDQLDIHTNIISMACDYFSRFLRETRALTKSKVQLFGTAALWISCKLWEVERVAMATLIWLTDNSITEEELVEAERVMLNKLEWNLLPHPHAHASRGHGELFL